MVKLNKKEIIKKLKPFWEKRMKFYLDFSKKEIELQKEMNKKINLDIDLEFFYVDGERVGIGAEDYSSRKDFSLVQDSDFN